MSQAVATLATSTSVHQPASRTARDMGRSAGAFEDDEGIGNG